MTLAYLCSPEFRDELSGRRPLADRAGAEVHQVPIMAAEAALVAALHAGDEAAYRTLVFDHFVPLVRFAMTILHTRESSEDVVQDVLARVWTQRNEWKPTGSVRAYLFATVRHRALNMLRHERVEERYAEQSFETAGNAASEQGEEDERAETLRRLVPELTERQQLVLSLRYEHRMTHAEVAQTLGISLRAAEQLAMRALDTLRTKLG